jgi:hypothetical protein
MRFSEPDLAVDAARDFGEAIRRACILVAPRGETGRRHRQPSLLVALYL